MGLTKYHRPMQLLERAGSTIQLQALIEPSAKLVLVVSGPLSQSDVDKYEWCLRTTHFGNWVERDQSGTDLKVVDADIGMKVPRITVSPGMVTTRDDRSREYVLVMEGASGPKKAQVIIEDSLERAATAMMHAALNGHSTVFSAAIPRRPSTRIFASIGPTNATFSKTDTIQQVSRESTGTVIGLIC